MNLLRLLRSRVVDGKPTAGLQFEIVRGATRYRNAQDEDLPLAAAPHHTVRRVRHDGEGATMADAVLADWDAHRPTAQDRFWIAVEASENRRLSTTLRSHYGVPRTHIDATAYWRNV